MRPPESPADGAAWLREWRREILSTPGLSASTKVCAIVLHEHMDWSGDEAGGSCWPSLATVQRRMGTRSRTTVSRAISALEAAGLIVRRCRRDDCDPPCLGGNGHSMGYQAALPAQPSGQWTAERSTQWTAEQESGGDAASAPVGSAVQPVDGSAVHTMDGNGPASGRQPSTKRTQPSLDLASTSTTTSADDLVAAEHGRIRSQLAKDYYDRNGEIPTPEALDGLLRDHLTDVYAREREHVARTIARAGGAR